MNQSVLFSTKNSYFSWYLLSTSLGHACEPMFRLPSMCGAYPHGQKMQLMFFQKMYNNNNNNKTYMTRCMKQWSLYHCRILGTWVAIVVGLLMTFGLPSDLVFLLNVAMTNNDHVQIFEVSGMVIPGFLLLHSAIHLPLCHFHLG